MNVKILEILKLLEMVPSTRPTWGSFENNISKITIEYLSHIN